MLDKKMTHQTGIKRLNYVRTGPVNLNPIVFLHAVGIDLGMWGQQIEAMQKHHDVIAYDLPGHGLSEKLAGDLTFENFADVISKSIENLNCGPVNLAGISFGGMIAQKIAIRRPDLVKSLSLIGTACSFTEQVRTTLRERADYVKNNGMKAIAPLSLSRWFTPEFALRRPDIIDNIKKMLYQQDSDYHSKIWDTISTLEMDVGLRGIDMPALIIVGEDDKSTPLSSATALAQALKSTNIHLVTGSAHFTNLEAPETVNKLLLNFINSVHE